jgi:porin
MRKLACGKGVVGLVLTACLAGTVAHADQWTVPTAPWLLGDWGGLRTHLYQQGIDFQFGYTNELATNTQGGAKRLTDYADQSQAGATLNLERLFGLHDAIFQMTFTERTGRDLVADAKLDTLQLIQEVYGRGQTTRLTQFWFDQKYLDGFVDWKVGRMGVGGDFAAFTCDYQNLTFCGANIGNILGKYIYNWPISQWATRVKFNWNGLGYFQVGAYDQNQRYLFYPQALLPVFYPGSTGALMPAELAWLPTFGNGTLPGSYKFGAFYSTATADDAVLDINGNPAAITNMPALQRHGFYGSYINFQQQITRNSTTNPNGGLNLFLNAAMVDKEVAHTDRQVAAGVMYTGPFSWRPNDNIAFAAGATHVNDRVATVEALQNSLSTTGPVAVQRSEYVYELFYTIIPAPGLYIRPNFQVVQYPGGSSLHKNAVVFGLKALANL